MQNLRRCRISEDADYLEKKAINQLEAGPEKIGKTISNNRFWR